MRKVHTRELSDTSLKSHRRDCGEGRGRRTVERLDLNALDHSDRGDRSQAPEGKFEEVTK